MTKKTLSIFGERVTLARKEAKYTQYSVCERLDIPRSTYSGYETQGKEATYVNLCKIADLFGVSVDYLVGHSDDKNPAGSRKLIGHAGKIEAALDAADADVNRDVTDMIEDMYIIIEAALGASSAQERQIYKDMLAAARKVAELHEQR